MFLWLQRSRGRCPQSPTRPLTGISCVVIGWFHPAGLTEFPSPRGDKLCPRSIWMPAPPPLFPSPRGDKLCRGALARQFIKQGFRPLAGISCVGRLYLAEMEGFGFRPLAGISCVYSYLSIMEHVFKFPSPRGDKLCPQNCPTGACGIQAGF